MEKDSKEDDMTGKEMELKEAIAIYRKCKEVCDTCPLSKNVKMEVGSIDVNTIDISLTGPICSFIITLESLLWQIK